MLRSDSVIGFKMMKTNAGSYIGNGLGCSSKSVPLNLQESENMG